MKKINKNRLFIVLLLVSLTVVSCKKPVAQVSNQNPVMTDPNTGAKVETLKPGTNSDYVPGYEIIKRSDAERKDSGSTFYVIIRPVDLTSNVFVVHLKNLVKKIVTTEKKEKITILIFDSLNALDWVVNQKSPQAPLLKTHFLAKYVGDAEGETYKNTLYIFPNAEKGNSEVGTYIDIVDFDPFNW